MQIKSVPLRGVKAGPDDGLNEGEFIVYPSTFTREPDSYGDVVSKGAFRDSIAKWKESGDVMPGMYLHDPNQIVAEAIDMGEDDHGWWVKGKFDDDPNAQKVYRWLKGRRLSALSFGFHTEEEGPVELPDGKSANELRKLDALEFSFLPKGFAANSDTSVVAVKTLADAAVAECKAGRVLAAKHIESLRSAQNAIGEVIKAAEASNDQDGKASDRGRAKDEEQGSATSGQPVAKSEELRTTSPVERLAAQAKIYALSGSAEGGSL